MEIISPPQPLLETLRPILEHGGGCMQHNVSNETQFHQMRLACAGQANTKHSYFYAGLRCAA